MPDEDEVRHAADAVRRASASFTPPDAASLASRHQRRARAGFLATLIAVLLIGGGALALARTGRTGADVTDLASPSTGSIGTRVGTTPGSTPGSVPVPSQPTVVGTSTPTTTPKATTTETTVPTTDTTVADPRWDLTLAGTYVGIEHYALFTDRCPDTSNHLDATWHVGSSDIAYVADYCGENRADGTWHGKGTVVLTDTEGSTLQGTFEHTAPIGTPGEPYVIMLTGGTGRFSGATGACNVTVHIRELRFGEQEQSGDLTCLLHGP